MMHSMEADRSKQTWYEGDHLEGGMTFLKQSKHNLDKIWIASAGTDDLGRPQVLVIGFNSVQLIDHEHKVILDIGSREIRAVRAVEAIGTEVCTTGSFTDGTFKSSWLHHISASDATYIENLWLSLRPLNHDGTQLNPLPWREEEYAYYVGRVVTESAKCDVALIGLTTMANLVLGRRHDHLRGQSGGRLAEALNKLGMTSPAFADLGERYGAWYTKRNFAVHGIRRTGEDGHPTSQVFKPTKNTVETLTEVEDQDFRDLALIWRAFYALRLDASDAGYHLAFYNAKISEESPESFVTRTPQFNTVSTSERMPWR